MARPAHFAEHGIEKMMYDVRMGPQAVFHEGVIYIVYPINTDGVGGHPHIRSYNVRKGVWSEGVRIGNVHRYDHHYAPVLWVDSADHLHILYGCHGQPGTHVVSAEPKAIRDWNPAPEIGHSISYPRVLPLPGGRHLMYSRTFGHMGYWTYRISEDGNTWSDSTPLIDFDQNPQSNTDLWASTYQSVSLNTEATGLHICFVTFHEEDGVRKNPNPLYRVYVSHSDRRNLYYAHLDIESGRVTTIEGVDLKVPVTRLIAEDCKVWDSGQRMTNPPAVMDDGAGRPLMLLPVAGQESPWKGEHVFIRWNGDDWTQVPVASLNSTWSGGWLTQEDDVLTALITTGDADGSLLSYGGGRIEKWMSSDRGDSWQKESEWVPEEGMIYNNPRPVPTSRGDILDGAYTMFGWEGPDGLTKEKCCGRAFLYFRGEWV